LLALFIFGLNFPSASIEYLGGTQVG